MGGVGLPTPIASKDAEEVYNRGERSASEFVPPHGASGGSRSSNNPVVQAQTQTDLSLDRVLSPTPDSNVSRWDSVQISVEVTNPTGGSFTPRSIAWYICEEPAISAGASACQGASIDDGQSVIQGLSSTEAFTFTTAHSPSGGTGLRGLVVRFVDADSDPSNDVLLTRFTLPDILVDVATDPDQEIFVSTEGLAVRSGEPVFNTGIDYPLTLNGVVQSCPSCALVAELGWRLLSNDGSVELSRATVNVSDLPDLGEAPFTRSLPSLNLSLTGRFLLEYGVFGSTGDVSADLNGHNDRAQLEIVVDDSVDLVVQTMRSAYDTDSLDYHYGNDSVEVIVRNDGNTSLEQAPVSFEISNQFGEVETTEVKRIPLIRPDETIRLTFNINMLGTKSISASVPTSFTRGYDVRSGNNEISENQAQIIQGALDPIIRPANDRTVYDTGDAIQLVAQVDSTAARPLVFEWWRFGGLVRLGEGEVFQFNASVLGMGDERITLLVRDALGSVESATVDLTVYNRTLLRSLPDIDGTAVTRAQAELAYSKALPPLGLQYVLPDGHQPLMLLSIDVISTEAGVTDVGMDWMDLELNLSAILPPNVDLSSVTARRVPDVQYAFWEDLSAPEDLTNTNGALTVRLTRNADLLLTGATPEVSVSSGDVSADLRPNGGMTVRWGPLGDIDNVYFGGWSVHRLDVPSTGGTIFPDPNVNLDTFVWDALTADSRVALLPASASHWEDPDELLTGSCASYAVIPLSRSLEPAYDRSNVTRGADGTAQMVCGDAIAPSVEVLSLRGVSTFTNSTQCYEAQGLDWNACYRVEVSWRWPDHEPEGNVSWNLYRLEHRPSETLILGVEPLERNISGVPGEQGIYIDEGNVTNGVRPDRVYYYVLAPIDHVGNENLIATHPAANTVRVDVENEFWSYNQHLIPVPPPPPDPPLGMESLRAWDEALGTTPFQVAGLVLVIAVCVNALMIPLLLRMRRRVMSRAKTNEKKTGEFEDDLSSFFS